MKKLIDKEKLIEKISNIKNELTSHCGGYQYLSNWEKDVYDELELFAKIIEDEPVIEDVAPVKHGNWIFEVKKGGGTDYHVRAHCSECGHKWFGEDGVGNPKYVFSAFVNGPSECAITFVLEQAKRRKFANYCENCGAKMEVNDD